MSNAFAAFGTALHPKEPWFSGEPVYLDSDTIPSDIWFMDVGLLKVVDHGCEPWLKPANRGSLSMGNGQSTGWWAHSGWACLINTSLMMDSSCDYNGLILVMNKPLYNGSWLWCIYKSPILDLNTLNHFFLLMCSSIVVDHIRMLVIHLFETQHISLLINQPLGH